MAHPWTDAALRPMARFLQADHMKRLGIAATMRVARSINQLRHRREIGRRRELYEKHFTELIRENGEPKTPLPELRDGWALDTSQSLPHLPRLLEESAALIAERGGVKRKEAGAYRSFFQNILQPGDLEKYPAILDFALSSEVLTIVSRYLRCIPALYTQLPGGVRFAESRIEYDDQPDVFKDSQLFHIDYFAQPNVYMIVLLQEVTPEHGPFCFVPASVSQRTAAALNYWGRGRPYRLSDEEVYTVLDRKDVQPLTYPAGTVLFLDSSACFHYGSRRSVRPRYQLMYAYGTGCRSDFNDLLTRRHVYPDRPGASRLARLALNLDPTAVDA